LFDKVGLFVQARRITSVLREWVAMRPWALTGLMIPAVSWDRAVHPVVIGL